MAVKINTRSDDAPKPLFEAIEPEPAPVPKSGTLLPAKLPFAFHMEGTPPTPGWNPMSTAPEDRPILVCTSMHSVGDKWAYYEVQWFLPEDWHKPGWFIVGTQWLQLSHALPKGWREAIGHP